MARFRLTAGRVAASFLAGVFAVAVAFADEIVTAQWEETVHVVVKGDTLWDIAEAYLEDPFRWPNIWRINDQVVNPDLIYPGGKIRIPIALLRPEIRELVAEPTLGELEPEAAPMEPEEAPALEEELEMETAAGPEPELETVEAGLEAEEGEGPAPAELEPELESEKEPVMVVEVVVPRGAINPFLVESSGYLAKHVKSVGVVVGDREGRSMAAQGDTVFLSLEHGADRNPGAQFLVVRLRDRVTHPTTFANLGHIVEVLGVVRTGARAGRVHQAEITRSYDAIHPGDLLLPYERPDVSVSEAEPKIKGMIVATRDDKSVVSDNDAVYLDRGRKDGLEPGVTLAVYRTGNRVDVPGGLGQRVRLPDELVGTLQVVSVRDRNATAVVLHAGDAIRVGDRVLSPTNGNDPAD